MNSVISMDMPTINDSTASQIEYVSNVLTQFYHSPTKENQETYERLLTSDIAWNLCSLMLDPTNTHPNVQFFGASVIFSRIARLSHKIGLEERIQVRSDLVTYISRYACDSSPECSNEAVKDTPPSHVYTRLCVALVRLAMKMNSDGQWPNPIEDICLILASCSQQLSHTVIHQTVCKLLGLFAEELKSHQQTSIHENSQNHILVGSAAYVFELIEQNLQGNDSELQCLSSWARLGVDISLYTPKLLDFMFASLRQNRDIDLSENACDCIGELISTRGLVQYSNRIWIHEILPRILQFSSIIRIAATLETPVDDDYMDYLVRLVKVFTQFVEIHSSCLISSDCSVSTRMAVFNLLIECVAFPGQFPYEERVSELTLSSWYAITDELCIDTGTESENCLFDRSEDELDQENPEDEFELSAFSERSLKNSPLVDEVCQYFVSGVRAMVKKCCYPLSNSELNAEELELFRIYRINISDIINFSICILKHNVFNILVGCMQCAVHYASWSYQEACLYLLGSLIEQEDVEEYIVNWILELMPTLNFELDERYLVTGIIFAGQLAEAVVCNKQCLTYCVLFCLKYLKNPAFTMHATMSLRSIARENREHLVDLAELISSKCAEIIDDPKYEQIDRSRCMAIIGYALSFVSPVESLISCFEAVIAPFIRRLFDQLSKSGDMTAEEQKDLMFDFSLISSFVCSFTTPIEEYNATLREKLTESCALLLNGLLPILVNIAESKQCTDKIFKLCMEIFSRFLAFLEEKFEPFLPRISALILDKQTQLNSFTLNFIRQCCLLSHLLSSPKKTGQLVKTNPKFTEQSAVISRNLFSHIITISLQSYQNMDSDYYVDFVLFLHQILKVRTSLIDNLQDNVFQLLLEMLVYGIQLKEQPAVQASSDCIILMIRMPRGTRLLSSYSQQLFNILINCILLKTPIVCMDAVFRSFLALTKPEHSIPVTTWLRSMLADEAFFRATNMEKEKLIMILTRQRDCRSKCLKAIREFADIVRGSWTSKQD
ncbi:hypothetical protein GJ496_005773 [Pomphorhynchus laevis]|nr:hypothetical protein GJ496_005773 [Pomphorhynchus laevis]